jgi:hypothetical protein
VVDEKNLNLVLCLMVFSGHPYMELQCRGKKKVEVIPDWLLDPTLNIATTNESFSPRASVSVKWERVLGATRVLDDYEPPTAAAAAPNRVLDAFADRVEISGRAVNPTNRRPSPESAVDARPSMAFSIPPVIFGSRSTDAVDVGGGRKRFRRLTVSERFQNRDSGWWQGNGISLVRADTILKKVPQGCSSCLACQRERCLKCGLCCLSSESAPGACVFWCCQNNDAAIVDLYIKEMGRMQMRKNKCLDVGSRVYYKVAVGPPALEPTDLLGISYMCPSASLLPQQCWGIVQSKIQDSGPRRFTISFEDDRVKTLAEQVGITLTSTQHSVHCTKYV